MVRACDELLKPAFSRYSTQAPSEGAFVALRSDRPIGGIAKRAFDIVAGIICVAISAPLLVGCCLSILASRGPVLYRHRRIGFAGREFICLKFRTMENDAERRLREHLAADPEARREWTHKHKLENDPRITTLGRRLRRASLDELPQLFNVLRGEMSLVGPRPIVADEIAKYQQHFSHYASARPGLTGLWQVRGRNGTSYAQRVAYDVEYVRNWSLMRDIKIILATAAHVIDGKGAY
jgi:exopolysaccharide production protein ExoY